MKQWLVREAIIRVFGKAIAQAVGGIVAAICTSFIASWWRGTRHPVFRMRDFVRGSRLAQISLFAVSGAIAYEFLGGSIAELFPIVGGIAMATVYGLGWFFLWLMPFAPLVALCLIPAYAFVRHRRKSRRRIAV